MNDLLDQIADLIPCHRYSHYLTCNCLFHHETNPSMFIYADGYHCMSCGAHGTTKHLLAHLLGHPVHQSEKLFHPHLWRFLKEEGDIEELALEAKHRLDINPDNGYYLKQRGIWAVAQKLLYGYLDGWFTFPVLGKNHEIMGIVARAGQVAEQNFGMRYILPPGQEPQLYVPDWNFLDQYDYVFMPIGIIDAISLSLAGLPVITGTTGHYLPIEMFKSIRKLIYIIPDGDKKDDKTIRKLATELGWRGKIIELEYPEGTKDANDIHVKYGLDTLHDLVTLTKERDNKYSFVIK